VAQAEQQFVVVNRWLAHNGVNHRVFDPVSLIMETISVHIWRELDPGRSWLRKYPGIEALASRFTAFDQDNVYDISRRADR